VPVLGALPTGDLAFGFLGIAVPIVIAFLAAALLRARLVRELDVEYPLLWLGGAAVGMGVVAGLLLGLLAAVSGGAAGPGRLAEVGPDALAVGLFAALEVTVAAALGLLVSRQR